MTTKYNAQALMDEVQKEHPSLSGYTLAIFAIQRAIEQREATEQELHDFRQEVSGVVGDTLFMVETHCDGEAVALVSNRLLQFIIPKPKPDPLVDAAKMMGYFNTAANAWAEDVRASLDALGFEIREKNDG